MSCLVLSTGFRWVWERSGRSGHAAVSTVGQPPSCTHTVCIIRHRRIVQRRAKKRKRKRKSRVEILTLRISLPPDLRMCSRARPMLGPDRGGDGAVSCGSQGAGRSRPHATQTTRDATHIHRNPAALPLPRMTRRCCPRRQPQNSHELAPMG